MSCSRIAFISRRERQEDHHYILSDGEFRRQFLDGTLDPGHFNHEAHLRIAWLHLRDYGPRLAAKFLVTQLRRFDRIHGTGLKFNEGLTLAAVRAVASLYEGSKAVSFLEFLEENPVLKSDFRTLIARH